MKKIKVFETFAGIGAQHKAFSILKEKNKINFDVVATSEWDIWSNLSYNAIHHNNKNIAKNISDEELNSFLSCFTHSRDSKNPTSMSYINKQGRYFKEMLYSAYKNSNNLGSIVNITGGYLLEKTKGIDLLTYSFPCQDLSSAGNFHGFNQGMAKDSKTRSGLLWEIERILDEINDISKDNLPNFLLLENVKNMLSSKHIKDYKIWLNKLNKLGYNTKTFVLKSNLYGSAQIRERVYAISVKNNKIYKDTFLSTGKIIENNFLIKDLSKEIKIDQNLEDIIITNCNLDEELNKEILDSIPNWTNSRKKMFKDNPKLFVYDAKNLKNKTKYKATKNGFILFNTRTITTKQDRNPNAGVIDLRGSSLEKTKQLKNKSKFRLLTPRECYLLMGFENKDFNKVKEINLLRKAVLYRQAGNSIVVNVLVSIFSYINNLDN